MVPGGREALGKRDPEGYYVILAKPEAEELLKGFDALIERGPVLVVRTKSRSAAARILAVLRARGMLAEA